MAAEFISSLDFAVLPFIRIYQYNAFHYPIIVLIKPRKWGKLL